MRVLHAEEYGRIEGLDFSNDLELRSDVVRQEYVVIRRDNQVSGGGNYERLKQAAFAGGVVGLLPLTRDLAVLVEPRFPVNLARMVEAVGQVGTAIDFIRNYQSGEPGEAEDWMLFALCERFVQESEQVMAQGLYRTYEHRQESTSSPKGRILVGETIARHIARNVPYKTEVSYFVKSVTNPPNQAIVEALFWVKDFLAARRDSPARRLRPRCDALLLSLSHIERDRGHLFTRDPRVLDPKVLPDTRSAYRNAVSLALALLERRGFTLDAEPGELALNSLLIRTDQVFEVFIRKMLAAHIPDRSLSIVDGNRMAKRRLFEVVPPEQVPPDVNHLPQGENVIQPDILIEDRAGRTLLAADVKYIGINNDIGGHADRHALEQVITYAHRLGCTKALSIHPVQTGQRSGLWLSGRVGPTMVFNYRVDLAAEDLEGEMRRMAEAIGSILH